MCFFLSLFFELRLCAIFVGTSTHSTHSKLSEYTGNYSFLKQIIQKFSHFFLADDDLVVRRRKEGEGPAVSKK